MAIEQHLAKPLQAPPGRSRGGQEKKKKAAGAMEKWGEDKLGKQMTCERGGIFNDSCLYSQALDTTRGQIQQNKQRCTEVCSNSITVCTSCLVLEVIGMHVGTALEL